MNTLTSKCTVMFYLFGNVIKISLGRLNDLWIVWQSYDSSALTETTWFSVDCGIVISAYSQRHGYNEFYTNNWPSNKQTTEQYVYFQCENKGKLINTRTTTKNHVEHSNLCMHGAHYTISQFGNGTNETHQRSFSFFFSSKSNENSIIFMHFMELVLNLNLI